MGRRPFRSAAAVALVIVVCASCARPADLDHIDRPSSSSSTSVSPSRTSPPSVPAGIPQVLVGDWRSLDQGSAEVLYSIHADGSFERAMVLMQSRSSGTFSYSIGTSGKLKVDGSRLILKPRKGIKSMHDPDSASGSYQDRPLTDLSAEPYSWSVTDDRLSLDGEYGLVVYARE